MSDRLGGVGASPPIEAYRPLIDAAPLGMGCLRVADGTWTLCNRLMTEALEALGPERPPFADAVDRAPAEHRATTPDGSRELRFRLSRLDPEHLLVVVDAPFDPSPPVPDDVAQRMDVVGRLAAGVAHDFNNVIAVIVGYSKQVLGRLSDSDPNTKALDAILRAGELAATLNRQLLALGRRQSLSPQRLDVNHALRRIETVLRPLLPVSIQMEVRVDATIDEVWCDPTQLQQVLMNLVINARDAQPEGGRIVIETAIAPLEAVPQAGNKRFVVITVSDTGKGIPSDVLPRVFEPFYTTKPSSSTGLGLAVVYGIVHQSGGRVTVGSTLGEGTSFRVYLPVAPPFEGELELETASGDALRQRGGENVLLVEDEPMVARLTRTYLQSGGYRVVIASCPSQALEVLKTQQVDLMLTDVVMPEMSGPALAEEVRRLKPDMPVLFMSGYADDAMAQHGLARGSRLLQKPFVCATLLRVVREELDAARS